MKLNTEIEYEHSQTFFGLFLAVIAGVVSAATIYVDPAATGAGNGTSWADAYNTIHDAVAASLAGDIIRVASGEYLLASEIVVDKAVAILGENGAASTTVNGGGVTRCFNMSADGVIDGFTITNGVTTTGGGGVKMTAGTVRNCFITKNSAGTDAGAGGGGGGVWISGGLVYDCDIVGNTGRVGSDDGGGGVRMTGGVVSNCLISANQAVGSGAAGGGACLKNSSALLVDCILTQNTAAWGSCGSYIFPGRALRCTFTGNTGSNGAGVGMRDGGIVDTCIITNNTGDGVYYRVGYVRNSLIANNTRHGVYTTQTGGEISSCTIANNGSTGVYLTGGGSLIRSNIIYGNTSIYGSGGIATATWINNLTPTAVSEALVVSDNVVGDPLFSSPSTGDFRVLKASPAVDAGLDLSSVGIIVDVAGTPRPTRYGADIGCYEEAQAVRVHNTAPVATS